LRICWYADLNLFYCRQGTYNWAGLIWIWSPTFRAPHLVCLLKPKRGPLVVRGALPLRFKIFDPSNFCRISSSSFRRFWRYTKGLNDHSEINSKFCVVAAWVEKTYKNKPFWEGKLLHWQKQRSSSSVFKSFYRFYNDYLLNNHKLNVSSRNFRPIRFQIKISKTHLRNNISGIKMFSWWRTNKCSFTNFWCSIIKNNFLPMLKAIICTFSDHFIVKNLQ